MGQILVRLKRIELAGFKSFVDPTTIDLDQGITAIVGPNGCGKSNIVDALRWVLGEHSARQLRGGVMDDLIFQGSDSRAPVALCDVELTFNIEIGSLAPPYHSLNEIRIRRRLTREGGSDAFINGNMVRLKDIVDLFLDTGISTRAYAIIEQDSIARMVTAKPEERRIIFEEAAGVMKYRSRRRETERRMQDTRLNLDRVLDLRDEIRSQCRSLKQQASRAQRFKHLQDEFSQLQSLCLGLRYHELQEHYQRIEQQFTQAQQAEIEATLHFTGCEKTASQAHANVLKHEEKAQELQDYLRRAEQTRADLQQQRERISGEQRLLTERKTFLQSRIHESNKQQQGISLDLEQLKKQRDQRHDATLITAQQQASQVVDDTSKAYREQSNRRDQLLAEYERSRQHNHQAEAQRQTAEQALVRLDQRQVQLKTQASQLHGQYRQQQRQATTLTKQLLSAQHSQQQTITTLKHAQSKLDTCRQQRANSTHSLHQYELEVRELHGVAQELRGRSIHQDVSDQLRQSLRAHGGLWIDEWVNGEIEAKVDENHRLHIPEELEAAVAAALRGRSADVYLPQQSSATLQQILQQSGTTPIALFMAPEEQPSEAKDSLAKALNLHAKHPLYAVFSTLRLVESCAELMHHSEDPNQYCISRDGWRREPNGWFIPPAKNRTARRLAVQRKLRNNAAMVASAESTLHRALQQSDAAELALAQQQHIWQQDHLNATQAENQVQASDAALVRNQAEITALQVQQQRSQADLKELSKERQYWQEQIQQVADLDRLVSLQAQAQTHLKDQQHILDQADQARNHARQHKAQTDQSLALLAQSRDHLRLEYERLELELARLSELIATDTTRSQQVELELQKIQKAQSLDQQLTQAVLAVEQAHQALNTGRETSHTLQQVQGDAERNAQQARQNQQLTSSQRQQIEIEQAQYTTRLQNAEQDIQQHFHVSASELLHKIEALALSEDSDTIMQRANDMQERISHFGPVNLLAIEEFDQASEREGFLNSQADDLETSLNTLANTISSIDRTTKQRFKTVFDQTNAYFKQLFPQLFGGGRAELKLDSDDILTAGVEVIAQPPGKHLQDITLLSGGEKALTAVALVFSIFNIKPAPFCVLDEVDAPLDDANVVRFADMVRGLSDRIQFLSISHNKITMQKADRLIGVSMPEAGVSKIVSVDMIKLPN